MTYGYSKDGGRGARLRRSTDGASPVGAALLGVALAAAVEDTPPRPGGVVDQLTTRIIEMMEAGGAKSQRCPCIYPDVDPETVGDDAPDGVCACGHVADEHADDGQCQAADAC